MKLSTLLLCICYFVLLEKTVAAISGTGSDSISNSGHSFQATLLLSEYLQYPSVSGNEKEAGQFLANFCKNNGLVVDYYSEEQSRFNFSASIYPQSLGKPNIVLLNHIDVVPAEDSLNWKYDPYSGTIADGYIWGRGAIDAKGLAVMQLMAILEMKQRALVEELPYNVTLLSVSGEELGGSNGSKIITDFFLEYLNPVVIFGEGGSGLKNVLYSKPEKDVYGISLAEKSTLWLKLELTHDTFGHGATPVKNYANKLMIKALNRINSRKTKLKFNRSNRLMFRKFGKAEGGVRGFLIRNINWWILQPFVKKIIQDDPLFTSLVTNTITVTNIYNPPGPPNKISKYSSATLDCRLLPGTNKKAFLRQLKNIIDEPELEISIINESPQGNFTKINDFYKCMEEAIMDHNPEAEVIPILFPATTDNSHFREEDVPVYGLIPAVLNQESIENIHSANEKISLEMLESGITVFTSFLRHAMEVPVNHETPVNIQRRRDF